MKTKKLAGCLALLVFAAFAGHAQNFYYKADNLTALNSAGSWTNNAVPTSTDWAVWDSNVATAANCTNEPLSGTLSLGGIQILNPNSTAITITNTGKVLTIGSLGIDLNEASSTANLSLVTQVETSGAQSWNIKPGLTLSLLEGSSQAVIVSGDLAINGYVKFNDKDFRVGTATLNITNDATTLDFTSSGGMSFSVGYGGNCTVNQTTGMVKLYKNSTSTGAMLLGANGSGESGTYNLNGGSLIDTNGASDYISVGDSSASVGTLNVNGGNVNVPQIQIGNSGYGYVNVTNGSITTPAADFIVNKGGNSLNGSLSVYGGTVSIPGHNLVVSKGGSASFANSGNVYLTGTGVINVGSSVQVPGSGANPGYVTLDGGAMNVTNNVTFLNSGSTGNGTLNLNGGTLAVNGVSISTGTGVAAFNLNGGTLAAMAGNGTFINTAVPTYVLGGGAVINSAGFNITIPAPLVNGTGDGADGGLTKLGLGTLTLSGTNTYTGPTLVSTGSLYLNTEIHTGGPISVSDGALLRTTLANSGETMPCASLTLGNSSGATAEFNTGTNLNPTAALIYATNLTANGTITVNVYDSALTAGTIPLIQYNTFSGSGTFVLNLAQGVGGYITNDTTAKTISLVALQLPPMIWRALVDTNWDTTTLNWVSTVDDSVVAFQNGAGTIFDDSTSNSLVNLTGAVAPTSVTISNNILNYTFTGPGNIIGTTGLTKQGTGTVTMSVTNGYSGATLISNGLFTLGINNAIPSASDTTVEGKLDLAGFSTGVHALNGNNGVVDNSGASAAVLTIGGNGGTFAGLITNSGASLALSKGGGSLYLSNTNNPYSGGTTNSSGLLQLASEHSIGTGPLALNGGTLAWSDGSAHTLTNVVTMGSGGVTLGSPTNANGLLTITGVVDFQSSGHGITCNEDTVLARGITNGALNNKAGPNLLTLNNTIGDWNSGSFSLNGGTLVLNSCTVTQDGSNIRIQCNTNAIARLVITNGSTLVMDGSSMANFRFGDSATAGIDATNIVDIYGTLYLTPVSGPSSGSNNKFQMGSSTDNPGQNIANLMSGGVLETKQILDLSPSSISTFNFNGGTLAVGTNDNAATFMQGLDNCFVLGSGAVIDTAGYDITIGQPLLNDGVDADGGLTKQGLGTLYLSGTSSYTNTTHVNVGGLGGTGTIVSPVIVASGASLLAGASPTNIGTFTINNTVTFNSSSQAAMKITKITGVTSSDNIAGVTTVHYGGTLVVTTNTDMNDVFAADDTFTLFSATTYNGSFTGYSLPTLPDGLGWDKSQLGVNGSIQVVVVPTSPPAFNSVVLNNGNLIMNGINGTVNGSYRVYATTNVALPLASWTPIATNNFDGSGNFSFTNAVNPAKPVQFFDISNP